MTREIKAPPEIKVLIVREEQTAEELEKLLTEKWQIARTDSAREIVIFVLVRNK